mmetsp:Transcript_66070/g.204811  ORF Transcript_66070/g.204811 Transcript_66070/m.204811 type:complete len:250 (-) Transcript_66070:44-793(-)
MCSVLMMHSSHAWACLTGAAAPARCPTVVLEVPAVAASRSRRWHFAGACRSPCCALSWCSEEPAMLVLATAAIQRRRRGGPLGARAAGPAPATRGLGGQAGNSPRCRRSTRRPRERLLPCCGSGRGRPAACAEQGVPPGWPVPGKRCTMLSSWCPAASARASRRHRPRRCCPPGWSAASTAAVRAAALDCGVARGARRPFCSSTARSRAGASQPLCAPPPWRGSCRRIVLLHGKMCHGRATRLGERCWM